jgi:hypothetical protein
VQRFKFHTRSRRPDESVADFLSQLRVLAEFCNFGGSLDTMLRDRFVCGIEHSAMQRKLLAESELTLVKTVEVAMSIEAAEKDDRTLGELPVSSSSECVQGHHSPAQPQWIGISMFSLW